MSTRTFFHGLVAATLILGTLYTVPATAAGKIPGHPRVNQVNQRFQNQGSRINQGRGNGTLTRGQANRIRTEDHSIKSEEHTMRSDDNGHLTRADQRSLNQQLNHTSAQIYNDKHDGGDIPGHPRVNQVNHRFDNQGDRIGHDLNNGSLSTSQAQQLRSQDGSIKQEEHTMRSDDDGHLTGADQRSLNQQLNTESKDIYQDSHPAPVATP